MAGKLIFLDLDGCINNRTTMDRFPSFDEDSIYVVEPSCMKALNRIMEETGAMVVVSSTWRFQWPARSLMQMALSARGFHGLVEGCTPRLPGEVTRGREIQAWLNDHNGPRQWPNPKFVVIDDDSDISPFEDRFVHTNFEFGLTEEDADKAIALLGKVK